MKLQQVLSAADGAMPDLPLITLFQPISAHWSRQKTKKADTLSSYETAENMDLFDSTPTPHSNRAPETTPAQFFKKAQPHSVAKADIVSKYAITWANIVVKSRKNRQEDAKVYIVDLFCGGGIYDCGTKSTPIRLLEQAVEKSHLLDNVTIWFNDESAEMVERLEANVKRIEGHNGFKYPINFTSRRAESAAVARWFTNNAEKPSPTPLLVFIDPFGYKEISRELLRSIIKTPQSDIIMFFNFRRINAAMGNQQFESNMNKIFGDERVQRMKQQLEHLKPHEREKLIMDNLEESLKEIGAGFVIPYVVVPENEEHVSHYIVGITKHEKGYAEMKKRFRIESKISENAQANFGFNPASIERDRLEKLQPSLFDTGPAKLGRIELLANQLHQDFQGQVKMFEPMYKAHHIGTMHTESEYKQAIRLLLTSGRARSTDFEGNTTRKNPKGEQGIGPSFKIRFV